MRGAVGCRSRSKTAVSGRLLENGRHTAVPPSVECQTPMSAPTHTLFALFGSTTTALWCTRSNVVAPVPLRADHLVATGRALSKFHAALVAIPPTVK